MRLNPLLQGWYSPSRHLPCLPKEASAQAEEEAKQCLLSALGVLLHPPSLAQLQQAPVASRGGISIAANLIAPLCPAGIS